MNSEACLIAVSPKHKVLLVPEYSHLIKTAPGQDFVVRTLANRKAGEMPLMSAEVVIAGRETRSQFPLAAEYPLHFRKTYFPGRLHGSTQKEYERHMRVTEILGNPPAIGWTPRTFRSCFLPGRSYTRMSPFGVEPEEANIRIAHEMNPALAAGLWNFVEAAFEQIRKLHDAGITHGDVELHNLIVCLSPVELFVIDFENAATREELGESAWEVNERADLDNLLREAVYLQCALGRQHSDLANSAWLSMDRLFKNPDRFKREIDYQAGV